MLIDDLQQLRAHPRASLATLPTALHRLPRLSEHLAGPELWIKRDDLTGLAGGGNKTRVIGVADDEETEEKRERVLRLANATLDTLGEPARIAATDVEVVQSDPNPYGVASAGTLAAIRLFARTEGLIADPVYEGKAIRGLIDLVERGRLGPADRVLLLHLGGTHAVHAYANQLWEKEPTPYEAAT